MCINNMRINNLFFKIYIFTFIFQSTILLSQNISISKIDSTKLNTFKSQSLTFEVEDSLSYRLAFEKARLELGVDQKFKWRGKYYRTNFLGEEPIIYKKLDEIQKEYIHLVESANLKLDQLDQLIKQFKDSSQNELGKLKEKTNQISKNTIVLSDSDKNTSISIMIILIILVSFAIFLFILKRKMNSQNYTLSSVKLAHKRLEEETCKLDEKLLEALEQKLENQPDIPKDDHTLPLTLASEIHRMRKRLKIMDDSHGKRVLNKRIENLEDTLNEMQYEIIDFEGQKYNEGMSVQAQFIEDESLDENEEIISKVIKPQINYKGKLIQAAEVQVSQGV